MLLWLTEYLSQFVSGFAVFQYLTFRTMVSVMTALFTSLLIGPYVIDKLSELQLGQTVRDDGPQTHLSKAGTPTMGGALILIVIFVTTLLWGDLSSKHVWVVLLVTMALRNCCITCCLSANGLHMNNSVHPSLAGNLNGIALMFTSFGR